MLSGVTGHQNQLKLGHCCTCTASCKARPPLLRVVLAVVIPITCKSDHGLQQFKGISIPFSLAYCV